MRRRLSRRLGQALGVFALAVAAGCAAPPPDTALDATASDEWIRSYPLAPNGEVQIVGGAGSVDIQGGPGSTVEVRAERVARATTEASAREIVPRIEIREDVTPDKVVLQSQGLRGIQIGVEVRINYRLTVPAWANVRVRTANGPISVSGVEGRVVVSSANGDVKGSGLKGGVDARSTNKDVVMDLASFGTAPVELRSVNGNVVLTVPADAAASLEANVTNGTIDVKDLKLEPFGEPSRRRLRGRLNAGGSPIEITTVNGNITVSPRP